jgi:hypothetical protein
MTPSLEESTETSDKQGMRPFGWLYQLAVSERPTDETGCGLLQTPNVVDATGRKYTYPSGNHDKPFLCLPGQIAAMLPTPASRDYKGSNPGNPYDSLDSVIESGATKDQDGKRTGMKLQPAFVEWMMGYPESWTELPD